MEVYFAHSSEDLEVRWDSTDFCSHLPSENFLYHHNMPEGIITQWDRTGVPALVPLPLVENHYCAWGDLSFISSFGPTNHPVWELSFLRDLERTILDRSNSQSSTVSLWLQLWEIIVMPSEKTLDRSGQLMGPQLQVCVMVDHGCFPQMATAEHAVSSL